ncbi:ribonuclease HII [Salinarchaeum laminariae]|uniref:ribonuclease HII n=1 Tax=Salinarchaeum laminariae TaxID=869888 RepID=UPI0020BFE5DE|nr:ribonuclease HII [Salinarchaeum laminariae]
MHIGTDEAGKGPVLGPMVAAAVGVPDPDVLPGDVADSKRLSPARREELDATIRDDDRIAVGVVAVGVDRIDDPDTDMNGLTVVAHADATESVLANGEMMDANEETTEAAPGAADGSREIELLADACDTSEERFARRLSASIDADGSGTDKLAVDARHGADDEDPAVAAASIVAKVERDARVAEIATEFGDVGSGYPSDPTTRSFLEGYVREHERLPGCARRSWQTCEDVLASVEQAGLGEF